MVLSNLNLIKAREVLILVPLALLFISVKPQETEMLLDAESQEVELTLKSEFFTTGVIPVKDLNNITIAFGSCLNTFADAAIIHQILTSITQTSSDVWMWIGDAVYLDGQAFSLGSLPGAGYDIYDGTYVQNTFNSLKTNPDYIGLMNLAPVIGTWDDHDYGYDNADGSFPLKQRNMQIFLDFLDEPPTSLRRLQEGVYSSYYIGDDRMIKVILLDIRYNRDTQSTLSSVLDADTTFRFDDMLGEEQWAWLNTEFQDSTSAYTLIVSGTQFLPDDRPIVQNWYQNSLDRLLDMIKAYQKSGVIFLSGDVHFAEMIKHPCPSRVGYTNFYEFTSSGMTHSAAAFEIFQGIFSDKYSRDEDRFFDKNFGILRFNKQINPTGIPNLVFEARDLNGNVVLTREVPYSDLVYNSALANSYNGCDSSDSDGSSGIFDTIGGIFDDIFP